MLRDCCLIIRDEAGLAQIAARKELRNTLVEGLVGTRCI